MSDVYELSRKERLPLSRDRVLNAALELADEAGLSHLSMRKVAGRLGVEAMSLYNHVANKEDMLDGLVERVVAEFHRPDASQDWKIEMQVRGMAAYSALKAHPWATSLIVSRVNVGPHMLGYVDATLGSLVGAGFTYPMADHAWNTMDSHIYGFTLQEQNFPFDPDEYADQAAAYLAELPDDNWPHLRNLAGEVAARRYNGLHDFEFGLNLLLDGLDAKLKRSQF